MKYGLIFNIMLCLFLFSCGGTRYYHVEEPDKIILVLDDFSLCSGIGSFITVDYKANLVCSQSGKYAVLQKRKYFVSCYLVRPIENKYSCVFPNESKANMKV